MHYRTRHLVLFLAILFQAGISLPAFSQHSAEAPHSQHAATQPSGSDPLIDEMVILDSAYKEVVSAVALGDSERVHKALASMHGTMEKTHEGVRGGTVTVPKNAKRITDFVSMDRKFHDKLEALDRAARHNNQREMLRITKQLLEGCVRCHEMFRK